MIDTQEYDVAVIGSGPGGYVSAIRAAHNRLKTVCIEREALGGCCLNWGCIPSKAVIQAASAYDKAGKAAAMGIAISGVALDMAKMMGWKDTLVKRLTGGIGHLLKKNGVDVIYGTARIAGPGRVEVVTTDGSRSVSARNVVVATGTQVIELPSLAFDGERVLSARHLLDLRVLPRRLAVVGGGVIGLELGMAFAKLGSEVTVIELLDGLLVGVDPECTKWVTRKLKKLGVKVMLRSKATGYKEVAGELHVDVVSAEGRDPSTLVCDKLLVAVGFRPNAAGLGLDALGVELDRRGHVLVDAQCKTNVDGIYAIGDVTGAPYLAHRASKQGVVVADVLAGKSAAYDVGALPSAIFTDPEIATVGLSEEIAREAGYEPKVSKFPFAALGRAQIYETPAPGFVKLIVDAPSGLLLGAAVVGNSASDLIAELALAIELGALAEDVALTVHAHPTLPEAIAEAAEAAVHKAIHVV